MRARGQLTEVNLKNDKAKTRGFHLSLARKKVVWAYIFLAIPIVFFAYIRVYPALFAFQMSLHDYNPLAGRAALRRLRELRKSL